MKTPDLNLPEGIRACFHESPAQTAGALANDVAEFLRKRLEQAPEVTLVVSGGSTPTPFFHALRDEVLDWQRVNVLLADERWVPETDPASNTRLVREQLLQGRATEARLVPLIRHGVPPEQALPGINRALAKLPVPLDVVVLGMGNDGHTASLFPDAPELPQAMDPATPQRALMMTPPSQAHQRVTLSLNMLSGARFTALHLKGDDKLSTLARALADTGDDRNMPIRALLKPGLAVYWSP